MSNESECKKMYKNPVKYFVESGVEEKFTIWFNLYNFISFWYKCSMYDGLLNHDKMAHFVNEFIENYPDIEDSEDLLDENFEKILKKFYKRIKKVGPGYFE